jgi:photosystem II stability/assembly factor-like uncharacterized protein
VWSAGASDAWAVGGDIDADTGTIVHWDGAAWSTFSIPATSYLNAVRGTRPDNVWAFGMGGAILHWNGTAWSSMPNKTTQQLYGVWGSSASDAWAVGDDGVILHWAP